MPQWFGTTYAKDPLSGIKYPVRGHSPSRSSSSSSRSSHTSRSHNSHSTYHIDQRRQTTNQFGCIHDHDVNTPLRLENHRQYTYSNNSGQDRGYYRSLPSATPSPSTPSTVIYQNFNSPTQPPHQPYTVASPSPRPNHDASLSTLHADLSLLRSRLETTEQAHLLTKLHALESHSQSHHRPRRSRQSHSTYTSDSDTSTTYSSPPTYATHPPSYPSHLRPRSHTTSGGSTAAGHGTARLIGDFSVFPSEGSGRDGSHKRMVGDEADEILRDEMGGRFPYWRDERGDGYIFPYRMLTHSGS
ncbi:hypothetical protein GLAREA_03031 [Glarea lozoyensis ATCC 20868]|uniref:Uncharacterized protein n=1 Tax=Glarea lozoyensis (strain ATCC 20868 / MF5171) TaxID=1116229 RepID=S3CKQ7_GLAL2|nr:uncharacterized protein GLAREA_03031 [Glarea lozoyensis ATCC 20868]EPE27117.1 hypothetical protein GLAREA_03031 [Glarea lozoyensis ATCC 20868]